MVFRCVKCVCCVSVLYIKGCRILTRSAAMLPATEPHRDVKIEVIFLQCQESCVSKNPKHQITYTSLFTVSIHN